MNISKTSVYAVKLISNLAKKKEGELVMVENVAKEEMIPKHYAGKIMQRLTRYKVLESFKGRGGGFRISSKAKDKSVYEVIELLDGEINFNECLFKFKNCTHDNPCPFCKKWNSIGSQIDTLLHEYTISSLGADMNDYFSQ
ncbi:MAG: hypothetical protein CR986_02155 [Ignavibacteriae bacterium]|nr:MAG: hypothetical protein CR986_02155 [Ignavibacteriota bacterium]